MEEGNRGLMPNFFIVGAAKCGTTSLYHYLKQHPQVYMSPIKEPNHFSTDIDPKNFSQEYKRYEKSKNLDISTYVRGDMNQEQWGAYVHDPEDYRLLFRFSNQKKAIGEISNSYLYSRLAAHNIRITLPDSRIIIILRQPADRAFSHYQANLRDGRTTRSFREEIEHDDAKPSHGWGISHLYYELGLYHEQVKRFLTIFPRDQVKILLFDDLKQDRQHLVNDLFQFLQIDTPSNLDTADTHNEARIPRAPGFIKWITQTGLKRKLFRLLPKSRRSAIKSLFFKAEKPLFRPEDREWMTARYRGDIIQLEQLIQRDLRHWLGNAVK
jgi:hypothetical protein